MGKRYNKTVLLVTAVFLILIGSAVVFSANNPSRIVNDPTPTIVSEKTESEVKTQNEKVTYKGEDGKDALSLLKNIANVEQDSSGLVTGINGRKADNTKKEFWGFYVNGKMSEVGPAEYQSKDEDTMEWKIETY